MGSMTLTWWVNRVTNPVRKPQITPITVPPIATTKNDAMPARLGKKYAVRKGGRTSFQSKQNVLKHAKNKKINFKQI